MLREAERKESAKKEKEEEDARVVSRSNALRAEQVETRISLSYPLGEFLSL